MPNYTYAANRDLIPALQSGLLSTWGLQAQTLCPGRYPSWFKVGNNKGTETNNQLADSPNLQQVSEQSVAE